MNNMKKSKAETQKAVMSILLDEKPQTDEATANNSQTLEIDDLVPFSDHPFKLYEGERLDDMVRSIEELGVIVPVIVRPNSNDEYTYEILSGHNRVNAAKLAGLSKVPVVIKERLSDDEAKLIVTETNLVQRSFSDLSHSERAVIIKHHMDAIKAQGKRTDLVDEIKKLSNAHEINENSSSCQVGTKSERSNERVGKESGLSARNVARYMRIAELNSPLLDRIDSEEIAFIPAVSLSYLSPDEQTELNRLLEDSAYKVDMKKAESLREFSESKKLTNEKMIQILSGEINKKPKAKTIPPLKIKPKIYQKYFNGDITQTEMETVVDQALAEYFENHKEGEQII